MRNSSITARALEDYKTGGYSTQALALKYKVSEYYIRKNVMPKVTEEDKARALKTAVQKGRRKKDSYIAQYDLNGRLVATWTSLLALSNDFDIENVRRALSSSAHISQGFKWFRKYVE